MQDENPCLAPSPGRYWIANPPFQQYSRGGAANETEMYLIQNSSKPGKPSHKKGKKEERSAWSKTPEGQTRLRSLRMKSILVSGSSEFPATCPKSMWSFTCNRVASPYVSEQSWVRKKFLKNQQSHAGAEVLLLKRPSGESRAPPSKRRNDPGNNGKW